MSENFGETHITVDPDVPVIHTVRRFEAPAAKVFRAHVEPDLVQRWLGPTRHTMRIEQYDCRTGGAYRYELVSSDRSHRYFGSFHKVQENRLIVQTFTFEGMADLVALERFAFIDSDDGTSTLRASSLMESFAARDTFLAGGMDGVAEIHDQLARLLAAAPVGPDDDRSTLSEEQR